LFRADCTGSLDYVLFLRALSFVAAVRFTVATGGERRASLLARKHIVPLLLRGTAPTPAPDAADALPLDLSGATSGVLMRIRASLARLYTVYAAQEAVPVPWVDAVQPRGALTSSAFLLMMCELDVCPELLGQGSLGRVCTATPHSRLSRR
jgi:hypothetical protein